LGPLPRLTFQKHGASYQSGGWVLVRAGHPFPPLGKRRHAAAVSRPCFRRLEASKTLFVSRPTSEKFKL